MPENPYVSALRRVPAGATATFGELARLADRPRAARAAGRALAALALDDPRPWHRIVRRHGMLSSDPRRAEVQLARLRREGARPAADESIAGWARRRRAGRVGLWSSRALVVPDDPRASRADPARVEALRDERAGRARGFTPAGTTRAASRGRSGAQRVGARRDGAAPTAPRSEQRLRRGKTR